jgi:endonuclease/exonuclease/phosphatase family metal-dependent hydrolase
MFPFLLGLVGIAAGLNGDLTGPTAELSVMSYNIHGLPWPFATGRSKALSEIGTRLAQMRAAGTQPHLVLLQEAFTPDAKAIAQEAGYRFVVRGPARGDRLADVETSDERQYSRSDNALKGEGDGTFEDSGLMILSDYPIITVKKTPYPRFACAGYDCLANKGILMVRVAIPGAAQPITIFDTHMNSRRASGVRSIRSDTAFAWQAQFLRKFVRENTPDGAPAILAGDFNIGRRTYRETMIAGAGGVLPGGTDALRLALAENPPSMNKSDAEAIVMRAKDLMFARSGTGTRLAVEGYSVPFGNDAKGKTLSDHFGYVVRYAVKD